MQENNISEDKKNEEESKQKQKEDLIVLSLDWMALESAFEDNSPDVQSVLNVKTGEVTRLSGTLEWEKDFKKEMQEHPDEFVTIAPVPSRIQYIWMEQFIKSLSDKNLQEKLIAAIDGKGAFRRFKDILSLYSKEKERWFEYRAALVHLHIQEWLAKLKIKVQNQCPWSKEKELKIISQVENFQSNLSLNSKEKRDSLKQKAERLLDSLPPKELAFVVKFLEFLQNQKGDMKPH
jgi:hypothetical protein